MSKKKYKLTKEQWLGSNKTKEAKRLYEIKSDGEFKYYTDPTNEKTQVDNKKIAKDYFKYYTKGKSYQAGLSYKMRESFKDSFIFKTSKLQKMIDNDAFLLSDEKYETIKENKASSFNRKKIGNVSIRECGQDNNYIKFEFFPNEKELLKKRMEFFKSVNRSFYDVYVKALEKNGEITLEDWKKINFKSELKAVKEIEGFKPNGESIKTVKDLLKFSFNLSRENVDFVLDLLDEAYNSDLSDSSIEKIVENNYQNFLYWVYAEKNPITKKAANITAGLTKEGMKPNYEYNFANQKQGNFTQKDSEGKVVYTSKQEALNLFSLSESKDEQIDKIIDMYKLDILNNSITEFVNNNRISSASSKQLMGIVKSHYKDHVQIEDGDIVLDDIDKLLLSYTHKYMKGRAEKVIKFANNPAHERLDKYILNVFKVENVSGKLKVSLINKANENIKRLGKVHEDIKIPTLGQNELEQKKHITKLITMLSGNLAAARLQLMNAYSGDNDAPFFNQERLKNAFDDGLFDCEKLYDLHIADNFSLEQLNQYYLASLEQLRVLRNETTHITNFDFKELLSNQIIDNVTTKEIISAELDYYMSKSVEKRLFELKSTNIIDIYGENKNKLTQTVSQIGLYQNKYTELHRFDKVYKCLNDKKLNLIPEIKYRGTDVNKVTAIATTARKNLLRLMYEDFKIFIMQEHPSQLRTLIDDYTKFINNQAELNIPNSKNKDSKAVLAGRNTFKSKYILTNTSSNELSISKLYQNVQSDGSKSDEQFAANRKWNTFVAFAFMQYINEQFSSLKDYILLTYNIEFQANRVTTEQLETEYAELKANLEQKIEKIEIEQMSLPLVSLGLILNNRNLNTLIHGLVKFENNMKALSERVDFKGFIENDYQNYKFEKTIEILSIIVKNRIVVPNNTTINDYKFAFNNAIKNIEELEIQFNDTQKQAIYKAGEHYINFSELDLLKDYGSLNLFETFFDQHKQFKITKLDINRYEEMVRGSKAQEASEIINKFNVTLKKLKNKKSMEDYKIWCQQVQLANPTIRVNKWDKEDFESFKKEFIEFKKAMQTRVEYDYLKNKIRLSNLIDITNVFADSYEKLNEWSSRKERDAVYEKDGMNHLQQKYLNITASKKDKVVIKDDDSRYVRNAIAHFDILQSQKKDITTLADCYAKVYDMFSTDKKYRKDIYAVLQNIFENYGILLPDDVQKNEYTSLPDLKNVEIKLKCHNTFESISLISEEYANLLVTFVFGYPIKKSATYDNSKYIKIKSDENTNLKKVGEPNLGNPFGAL